MINIDRIESDSLDRHSIKVINDAIYELRELHSFDVDEFQEALNLYKNKGLRTSYREMVVDGWMNTEPGKWCTKNCHDINFECVPMIDPDSNITRVIVRGYISDLMWTFYTLKWR